MVYLFLLSLLLSAVAIRVQAEDVNVLSCPIEDTACLDKANSNLMYYFARGLGEPYNVKPIDPIEVPSVYVPNCCDQIQNWTNVKITGTKDVRITGFKIDQNAKRTYVNMTVNLQAVGDLDAIFQGKEVSGTLDFRPKVAVIYQYPYQLKVNDQDVSHYIIGPETVERCETLEEPQFTVNEELSKDPNVKAVFEEFPEGLLEVRNTVACELAKLALRNVLDGLRRVMKIIPASNFFTDFIA